MIASLMMYQRPELVEVNLRYWALIRKYLLEAGMDSPPELSQDAEPFSVWTSADLVLSQTCGMPYRLWLHDKVQLVGTPDYGVTGCSPGEYRSAIVVSRDDPRKSLDEFQGARFAYNQDHSQSGYAAPYWHLHSLGFWFEDRLQTSQHLLSARSVAEGTSDIAALDAVSWRLIKRYEPFAEQLRVIDWTEPTPGLPLITGRDNDPETVFMAVESAISALSDQDRRALLLKGITKIPATRYLSIPNPPRT